MKDMTRRLHKLERRGRPPEGKMAAVYQAYFAYYVDHGCSQSTAHREAMRSLNSPHGAWVSTLDAHGLALYVKAVRDEAGDLAAWPDSMLDGCLQSLEADMTESQNAQERPPESPADTS